MDIRCKVCRDTMHLKDGAPKSFRYFCCKNPVCDYGTVIPDQPALPAPKPLLALPAPKIEPIQEPEPQPDLLDLFF